MHQNKNIQAQEALDLILSNTPISTKTISKNLIQSIGFSLAEKIIADRNYPPFDRATMDGFALSFEDLANQKEFTIIGEIFAGDNWNYPNSIPPGSSVKIMTGAPVPPCFDLIIKLEDTVTDGVKVRINTGIFKQWMNIAKQGEDAQKGSVLVNPGKEIDDSIIIVAASLGYPALQVFCPPKISLVSTGNEVLPEGINPLPHQIRDSNSITLRAMLNKFHTEIVRLVNIPDNPEILATTFLDCFDSDICIITGGVSAGEADYIPSTLKNLGVEEIFHKVKIRPGKPIWFGKKEKTLFFGLPGNPISARIAFKIFVEPCIRKFIQLEEPTRCYLPILEARSKKHNLEEYFRVKIINKDDTMYLQEKKNNGSGDFIGSLGTDGIAIHPVDNNDLPVKTILQFIKW